MNLPIMSRTVVLAVGISTPGFASAPHINIRIINKAEAPPEVVARAQQIVADIFSVVGIQINWQECPMPKSQPLSTQEYGGRSAEIFVVINAGATPGSTRNALGVSLPSVGEGNRAGVFYSRIERVSQDRIVSLGASVAEVLAYAMAHEIGHLLLNWKTHSKEGIMRTEWTIVEFAAMRERKLFFTSSEAGVMRRAVQKRNSARAEPSSAR